MLIKRVRGSHNTNCHNCGKSLRGKFYTRFDGIGVNRWGSLVNGFVCDKCLKDAHKDIEKEPNDDDKDISGEQ